jgi:uncharacterized protein (DUF2237 family)
MRLEVVDLRAEAIAEARRLAGTRAMTVVGDASVLMQAEAEGPWIAVARRRRIRRALGRRLLLVWRVAVEDASGAPVESRLVAVTLELSHAVRGPLSRQRIEAIVRALEPQSRALIEADGRDWREAVDAVLGSFTLMRTTRERAIAVAAVTADGNAFQPGLFDRRAERAQQLATAAAARIGSVALHRLEAIARSTPIGPAAAKLLLVLVP